MSGATDFRLQEDGSSPLSPVRSADWLSAYAAYLKTAQWKNIRAVMLKLSDGKCARCGHGLPDLEVHHKTYERLGKERMTDLEVLCRTCHKAADEERAQQGKARSRVALANACYTSGRDTYMTKKYGEGWHDSHYGSEEFDEWLERKRNDIGG